MAYDLKNVRLALRTQLLTVAGLPGASLRQFENRDFQPPEPTRNAMWVRETCVPGDELHVATNTLEAIGLYQIDLFVPVGSGTENIETVANVIRLAFSPPRSLSYNSTDVVVYRASPLESTQERRADAVWYMLPVRMFWRTYSTANN